MENQWQSAMTIIAACMTMGSIILFIIAVQVNHRRKNLLRDNKIKELENEQQLFLLRTTHEIEEREKIRIYRDMHDQVNPLLRFVMRRIEKHRLELTRNSLTVESLDHDVELLLKGIESIRACVHELVPSFLIEYGVSRSLEDILKKINQTGNVTIAFQSENEDSIHSVFDQSDQLNIYRLTLELLNNVLRHSGCTDLKFFIGNSEKQLVLRIVHNGIAISNAQIERLTKESIGHGLKSCRARALMLNAKIDYIFSPFKQTVEVIVPHKL